jgi:tetratricopeptide (TPR) repeat protein
LDEVVMMSKYDVFLSHSSADTPAVEELGRRLKQAGVEPWLDKWKLVPGVPWQKDVEQALDDSASCAVVIGPGGVGSWHNEEMRVAIGRRVREGHGRFRVIPVLLPGVERPERGKLPAFLTAVTWVEFRSTLDDPDAMHRLVCGIRGVEPDPREPLYEGQCPYRGLEAFDEPHARFFFGREALTEWLLDALRPSPEPGRENRFLAVVGPSGSGKSSLALAGLVPAVRRGALEGSAEWPVVTLRPGPDPLESVAVALAGRDGRPADPSAVLGLARDLGDDPRALHLFTRLALRDAPPGRRLLVLVDQFEEVFTLSDKEPARRALVDNLHYASSVPGGQTVVVLTLRADFYGRCAGYHEFSAAVSGHHVLVGPMNADELRRAIERPARLVGCEFEPGLVETLLHDVTQQPGALPLLQFALKELWLRRDGHRLTASAYKEMGGLRGALETRANEILRGFSPSEREFCRRIFLRLTQPGEGTEDTRRRASLRELSSSEGDAAAVGAVVQRLADARLITTEGGERDPTEGFVEVAHEALIRGWPELRRWIDADRAGLRTHRRLTEAAQEWKTTGRDPSILYTGARLAVAREWAASHPGDPNALEAAFLAASVARERRSRRLIAGMSAAILITLLASGGLWLRARLDRNAHAARVAQRVAVAEAEATGRRAAARAASGDLALWAQAVAAAENAVTIARMGEAGESLLHRVQEALDATKVEQAEAEKNRRMLDRLEEIRLMEAEVTEDNVIDHARADSEYSKAFRDYGIDADALAPAQAATLLRKRFASTPQPLVSLAAALDDWAMSRKRRPKTDATTAEPGPGPTHDWRQLIELAQLVDPDPWRSRVRDAIKREDPAPLKELAATTDADADLQPPSFHLLASGLIAGGSHGEAEHVLRVGTWRHPGDFWLNWDFAVWLSAMKPPQWDWAVQFATTACALRSQSAVARYNLGFFLAKKGDREESIAAYREAIRLKPDLAEAHYNLGKALTSRAPEAAIGSYREAIRLKPDLAEAHYNLGKALTSRAPEAAIGTYREAIRLKPDLAEAHYELGNALRATIGRVSQPPGVVPPPPGAVPGSRGDSVALDEAIGSYREAIRLKPDLAEAHDKLGDALRDKAKRGDRGALDEAIGSYREAIRLEPKNAWVHITLGDALQDKGALDVAIGSYREAVRLEPKNVSAHMALGDALQAKGALDEAIGSFREAVRLEPDDDWARTRLGEALQAKGALDEAIGLHREAVRLKPDDQYTHIRLGNALWRKGALGEAIGSFREAVRLKPDDAGAHVDLGKALAAKGALGEAIGSFREAIRLEPDYAEAHFNLGTALAAKGAVDEAIGSYRAAIRLKPDNPWAHVNLGLALRNRGRLNDALFSLKKGHELGSKMPGWSVPSAQLVLDCERLVALERRLPAVLRGADRPADAVERIEFARLCQLDYRQLFAASARFYEAAFADRPGLAEDLQEGHRYNAACAAAQAASGQGKDAPPLDAAARSRWRRKALDWLGADLKGWSGRLDAGPDQARAEVVRMLRHWKADSDLAGLRDEAGLARLSGDDRKACEALWAKVDALLRRAEKATANGR